MLDNMRNFIAILVLLYFPVWHPSLPVAEGVIYPSIPGHLLECYRGGGPALGAPRRLDVFLSLLRTLEVNTQLDLRAFSAALLRSVRLDGIEQAANPVESEYVTPYRASAFQFHKYKLLMDLFVPSQNSLEVDGILTPDEKCLLHRMMSSTMYQWERGDEILTCPVSVEQRVDRLTGETRNTRVVSRCPIEEGVIQTPWGTISPGIITSAIAAALEAQRVSISDILNADVFKAGLAEPILENANEHWEDDIETLATAKSQLQVPNADISNIWVATLAGDLAEVAVNQGPRVGSAAQRLVIGSNNRWNDTILPRAYYLLLQNNSVVDWHFTDAEILAGIDGLILSQYVPTWVAQRNTLRLSQIIDMYYSNDGVTFDPSVKACNRRALYDKVFDRSQLLAEMSSFASVLSLSQGTVYMQAGELDRICEAAVAAFVAYVPTILSENEHSCATSPSVPVMDVVVATDGSWKGYDVEQFLSWLGGAMEVGLSRSSLSLLHGNTGAWVAPPSDNLTAVFSHIGNFTGSWPNRLNLPNILSTIIQYSRNQSLEESSAGTSAGPSTVLLIISPSDRISANDVETSRELMRSLRTSFFDVYFAYLAQDMTGFENVNNEYMDYSELFLKVDSITVQNAITSVKTDLLQHGIPMKIFGGHCPVNDTQFPQRAYEDFVQPGRTNEYRIHPYYLEGQMVVSVVFRNGGGGSLLACWWRGADSARSCHTLETRQLHVFNITTPCPSVDFCPPAHFTVSAAATLNLCANTDCRLPHQVGYYIEHSGLRCLALRSSATTIRPSFYMTLTFSWILGLLATKKYNKT